MKNLVLLLLFFCFIACKPSTPKMVDVGVTDVPDTKIPQEKRLGGTDLSAKFGMVTLERDGVLCLFTRSAGLLPNSQVPVIVLAFKTPQKVINTTIKESLEICYSGDMGPEEQAETYFYSLQPDGNENLSKNDVAIAAIGGSESLKLSKGVASVDLDGDGKYEYFGQCTSRAGLHSTVWVGKPPSGKVIWHNAHHLEYETIPTCSNKEVHGPDD